MTLLMTALMLVLAACSGQVDAESSGVEGPQPQSTPVGRVDTSDPTTTTTAPTTTTTAPTTTTLSSEQIAAAQLEADTRLIQQLWRGLSDSTLAGLDAHYEYLAANNHPDAGCTEADYRETNQFEGGFMMEAIVLPETVEPDPEWSPASGSLSGQIPKGRIYIHQLLVEYDFADGSSDDDRLEAHTAIVNEEAHFFISCS